MEFFKAAAQAAQDQVNELKLGAKELAEDLSGYTDALKKKSSTGNKELEFGEGPLGFRLEGTMVVSVEMGTQAATLGVEAGDRICAVAGYIVPEFDPDDEEAEQRAMKQVKKWLKEMPRPSLLTFVPIHVDNDDDDEDQAETPSTPVRNQASAEAASSPAAPTAGGGEAAQAVLDGEFDFSEHMTSAVEGDAGSQPNKAEMQALLKLAAEWQQQEEIADAAQPADVQALLAELRHEQEERLQLSSELHRSRNESSKAVANLSTAKATHQKEVEKLKAQLSSLREENKKLLLQASADVADNFSSLDTWEAREKVLEEECARLRKATADTAARNAKEVEELTARASAAEAKASAAELRIEALTCELKGFCTAHEAELELLRGERSELECRNREQQEAHAQRLRDLEEQSARQLAEVRSEVEEAEQRATQFKAAAEAAEAEASAAALEATSARAELKQAALQARLEQPLKEIDLADDEDPAARQDPPSPSAQREAQPDTMALYERIDMLERRVVSLQKKLNSRPVVFQNPLGGDAELGDNPLRNRPSWELSIVSIAGPRAGAIAVLMYLTVDTALRNFTKRLLKQDAWLWLFYTHLLVLYVISAASFTEVQPLSDGSTVDISLKQGSSLPSAPVTGGASAPVR